ncbi:hypothetical protein sscle_09g074450 [Sclerotinia sclerotiorum 1980 UF-70]|uniref:non-specific serine/threonine protein kinase n=1 Tax=Sclerotinia sclerotiorum (strain ATCC 18683 / 1980 / Ss-1) TaxID=665079 RepID=A0A1D9QCK6_SCLS1|nr:hypothetical protein sscle_09g074450 [Sclerotinia sclerotiorum 1980 UF-70]
MSSNGNKKTFSSDEDTMDEKSQCDSSTEDIHLPHLAPSTALTRFGDVRLPLPVGQSNNQQSTLFYLSLIEARCKAQALTTLNSGRAPHDQLPEDHPDIQRLAQVLFSDMASELRKSGVLPRADELASRQFAALREGYLSTFDLILANSASQRMQNSTFSQNSILPLASGSSFGLSYFDQPPNLNLEMIPKNPFSSAALTSNPFQYRSIYNREWEQISLLGKGGFGAVYKVRHRVDDLECAIKKVIITPDQLRKVDTAALLSEVKALAEHKHPNIVNYYGCWIEMGNEIVPSARRLMEADESSYLSMTLSGVERSEDELGLQEDPTFGMASLRLDMERELEKDNRRQRQGRISSDVIFDISETKTTTGSRKSTNVVEAEDGDGDEAGDEDDDDEDDNNDNAINSRDNRARILYIRFTVYPLTLEEYISTDAPQTGHEFPIRHCFHTTPTIRILSAILNGVQYLHAKRLIHRDLKPANIFLSAKKDLEAFVPSYDLIDVSRRACPTCTGTADQNKAYITPCIGDLGLAVKLAETTATPATGPYTRAIELNPSSQLSRLGSKQAGTKLYMPPGKSSIVCPKLDVYALGIIAFELITPFKTRTERHIVINNIKSGIYPTEFENHEMAEGIKGMIAENRSDRWDCERVREWIEGFRVA